MTWQPSPDELEHDPAPATTVPESESIDALWDDLLGMIYGRRFWNVGCG